MKTGPDPHVAFCTTVIAAVINDLSCSTELDSTFQNADDVATVTDSDSVTEGKRLTGVTAGSLTHDEDGCGTG
jgi:hypothetical protein